MTKRVLILGSSGFMGRYIVRHLEASDGYDLICPPRPRVQFGSVEALRRLIEESNPHTIVNLAAISSVTNTDTQAMYEVNAFGHHNLLLAASSAAQKPRIVFASSANVYGKNPNSAFRETDLPRPINHYGASKVLAETFCGMFDDTLSIACARPFNCIGREQNISFMLPKLVDGFKGRKDKIHLGNTAIVRDFVDIRDIARMWKSVIDAEDFRGAINFGSGTPTSVSRIIEILGQISGHSPEIVHDTNLVRPLDIAYACADVRLLHSVTDKERYTIEQTLRWIMNPDYD